VGAHRITGALKAI